MYVYPTSSFFVELQPMGTISRYIYLSFSSTCLKRIYISAHNVVCYTPKDYSGFMFRNAIYKQLLQAVWDNMAAAQLVK